MAKMKYYLQGATLVEVVVSTIIILIVFLLFSTFIGKILTSNSSSEQIKVLYSIPTNTNERPDTSNIKTNCGSCSFSTSIYTLDSAEVLQTNLLVGTRRQNVFRFYFIDINKKNDIFFR